MMDRRFKKSLFGGYQKKDVDAAITSLEAQLDELHEHASQLETSQNALRDDAAKLGVVNRSLKDDLAAKSSEIRRLEAKVQELRMLCDQNNASRKEYDQYLHNVGEIYMTACNSADNIVKRSIAEGSELIISLNAAVEKSRMRTQKIISHAQTTRENIKAALPGILAALTASFAQVDSLMDEACKLENAYSATLGLEQSFQQDLQDKLEAYHQTTKTMVTKVLSSVNEKENTDVVAPAAVSVTQPVPVAVIKPEPIAALHPVSAATSKPVLTVPSEPKSTVPPEPKSTVPSEPKSTVPSEPKSTVPPEPKSTVPPEPKSTVPPEPTPVAPEVPDEPFSVMEEHEAIKEPSKPADPTPPAPLMPDDAETKTAGPAMTLLQQVKLKRHMENAEKVEKAEIAFTEDPVKDAPANPQAKTADSDHPAPQAVQPSEQPAPYSMPSTYTHHQSVKDLLNKYSQLK